MTRSWSLTRESRCPSWLLTSSVTGMVFGYLAASSSACFNSTDAIKQAAKKRETRSVEGHTCTGFWRTSCWDKLLDSLCLLSQSVKTLRCKVDTWSTIVLLYIRQTHPQSPGSSRRESNTQLPVPRRIQNPAAEPASSQTSSWSELFPWRTSDART